jgi:hypothetical protein
MRSFTRLGSVNAALVSLYFAPVWGAEAFRALTSPYFGFEDRAQAVAASYLRALFDLGLDGLTRASTLLAGVKLVAAIAFVAYLIDFARALLADREPNRETLGAALLLAATALMLWAWPALATAAGDLIRLQATQFLLLAGVMVVTLVGRQIEENAPAPQPVEDDRAALACQPAVAA